MIVVQAVAYLVVCIGVIVATVGTVMLVLRQRGCIPPPNERFAEWRRVFLTGAAMVFLGGLAGIAASFAAPRSAAPPVAHVGSASTSRPSLSKSEIQR